MYPKGSRKTTYPRSSYRKKRYGPSRSKQLVTGDRQPTLVEQIASGAGQVAKLATAVMPIISAINTEEKYSDKTASVQSFNPGTNDQIIALTDQINQGTTDTTRVGNSILAKGLQVRLAHNFATSAGPPAVVGIHCRMMLVCWKENASINVISAAKLFESPANLYSPVNKDYSDQFVVLKDKFFTLNAQNGALGGIPQAFTQMKIFKKLDWHIRYDGTSGVAATQNHIYLILRSSATGISTALSTTYYSRITFTDN